MGHQKPASVREIEDPTAPPAAWTSWRRVVGIPGHSKFTAEVQEMFIGAIARTGSTVIAAQVAGVTTRCVRYWFTKAREELDAIDEAFQADREPDPAPFAEFYLDCMRAGGWAKCRNVNIVQLQADSGDWRAAAWLLERLGGKLAAERLEVEHSGDTDIKDVVVTLEQKLDQMRERHAAVETPEDA